jgi:hypothetical protein
LGKTQGDDTYLLKYVLHDWDDERAVKILESCRRSMTADAKLLVMELMIPVTDEPSRGKLMDVSMMLLLSGASVRARRTAPYWPPRASASSGSCRRRAR